MKEKVKIKKAEPRKHICLRCGQSISPEKQIGILEEELVSARGQVRHLRQRLEEKALR